jgi:asparagine synthase (glutamine-hydrolysing)
VIIPLYLKYGVDFLSKLRGEFALVLFDLRRQLFLAARDRYGIKPLFWTVVQNRLLVSSEAKAFLPLGWQPEWDVRSLIEEGWLHDERTVFKGVRKVLILNCCFCPESYSVL